MSAPDAAALGRGTARRRAALRRAVRDYAAVLFRHRWVALPALLLPALGNTALFYVPPLVVARLAGRLADGGDRSFAALSPYLVVFVGALVVGEMCWRLGIHCLNRTDGRGIEDLYVSGMDALLAKDAAFFHDNFAGSLTKRLVSYAARFEEFVDTLSFSVVANVIPLLFASVVLWTYSPLLVAVLLGLIVVTAAVIAPLIGRRQTLVDQREAAWAKVSGSVADTIGNMDAVRAFGAERIEADGHRERVAEQRRLAIRSWDYANLRIDTIVAPLSILTLSLGLLVAIGIGAAGDVETVIVTFTFYGQATRILFEFNQTYRRFESSLTDAAQFTELLLDPPAIVDPVDPDALAPQHSGVRFDRVTFAHEGGAPLFDGLDLEVGSGERVGLVGRSGGGKTTLTKLLLRVNDVQGGRVLVGGQDVTRLRQRDLRSLISYVPQDPAMFHRSLRDNIAFGRPSATDADVLAAARAAHVLDFVQDLPDGMDTLVGERGVKLSGGQRQRVAIARAVLRDAPILLLDEATSALDSESEALIQEALWSLMTDRTAVVVAHRLSTVARMDRLVVLDRGRVSQTGSHTELLAVGGLYADLWSRQSGGFISEPAQEETGSTGMSGTEEALSGPVPVT